MGASTMIGSRRSILAAAALLLVGSAARAGQVNNPLDLPAGLAAGHILLSPTPPGQNAVDGGMPGTMATVNSPVPVANGGTGASAAGATAANHIGALAITNNLSDVGSAAAARSSLGAASAGANGDITSLTGLTTPLAFSEGGCNATSAAACLGNLGMQLGYVSGPYYLAPAITMTSGITLASANVMYATPFLALAPQTFTKISINVTAGAAGASCEIGVYANAGGKPGSLLVDAGNISVATTGTKEITGVSIPLTPGWWWEAVVCNGTPGLITFGASGAGGGTPWQMGYLSLGSSPNLAYSVSQTYGALPSSFGAGALTQSNATGPVVGLRF
ncbi:MAG: hypothetical protein ACREFC_14620 [Stellaceae bacterium]